MRNLHSFSLASLPILTIMSFTSALAEEILVTPKPIQTNRSIPQLFEKKNWSFTVGGGVMYGPKYEGSDNYGAMPIPDISAEYKEGLVFANWDGIGTYPIRGENYKVGASIGIAMGRSEDDDEENLRGMGDIDMGATANIMGEYDIGHLKISGKISSGDEDYGTTAKIEVGTMLPATDKLMLMASAGTTWADEKHMQSYFGVSSAQSVRSGYNQYDAKSGIKSVDVTVGAFYSVTKNWEAKVMVSATTLIDDVADSPLTKKDFNPAAIVTLGYKF